MKLSQLTLIFAGVLAFQSLPSQAQAQNQQQPSKEEIRKAEKEKKEQEKIAKAKAKEAKKNGPDPLVRDYDRFQDSTTVGFMTYITGQSTWPQKPYEIIMGSSYQFQGTDLSKASVLGRALILKYEDQSYDYVKDASLLLLVDNVPLNLGELSLVSTNVLTLCCGQFRTKRLFAVPVPLEVQERLANAQAIEGRFAGIEFKVPMKFISTLRGLVDESK